MYAFRCFLLSLLVLFSGSGCATITVTASMERFEEKFYIDKELKPYADKFIKASKGKVKKINNHVVFDRLAYSNPKDKDKTVGLCNYFLRTISIDRYFWSTLSELEKESLMFHEFGHCTLMRGHTAKKETKDTKITYYLEKAAFYLGILESRGYMADGCPASQMHPWTIDRQCLQHHYDYYIDELFNPNKDFSEYKAKQKMDIPKVINYYGFSPDFDLFISTIMCPKTEIENLSEEKWNDIDQKNFNMAKERCPIVTNLPCLKKFIKKEPLVYNAICSHPLK